MTESGTKTKTREPREWGSDVIRDGDITRHYCDGVLIGRIEPSRNTAGWFMVYSGKDGVEQFTDYPTRKWANAEVWKRSEY